LTSQPPREIACKYTVLRQVKILHAAVGPLGPTALSQIALFK